MDDTQVPNADTVVAGPQLPDVATALPGLSAGEPVPLSGPSPEQIARMNAAASARVQAAMNVPLGGVSPAPVASGGAGPSFPHDPPMVVPNIQQVAPGPNIQQAFASTQPSTLSTDPFPVLDPPANYTDKGDYYEVTMRGGRVTRVTKAEWRERCRVEHEVQTQSDRWAKELREKYGAPKTSAWELPAPPRADLAFLTTAAENQAHLCTTCKHAVRFVAGYAAQSGYSGHYFARNFCSLVEDPEGGHLELADSPIFDCSHYERRWGRWAKYQLSRLESRVSGKGDGKLARILKVLREKPVGNGTNGNGNGASK